MLRLGQFPFVAELLVFRSGENDVERLLRGIDRGDECAQPLFLHRRAASGGRSAAISPDVKKDRATRAFDDLGRGVVSNEKFQFMGGIALFHLLLFFPGCGGFVREDDVAVVGVRGGIFHPEVARGDLAVGKFRVLADRGIGSPCAADAKDSRGRATVALGFDGDFARIRVDSQAPDQAVFP